MQSKISLKCLFSTVSVAGIVFSLVIILFLTFYLPVQSSFTQTTSSIHGTSSGLPVRLKIPKINVDAAFEYVGLVPNGAMGAPKGPTHVAWFDLGPRPGEKGSSVVDGHFGWQNNIPAAFDNLDKLRKGDKLYVEDDKGTTTIFVVRELRAYGKNDDSSSVFRSSDGKSHLNLITCDGVWNETEQSYSDRLVVFTDKETEGPL